MGLRMIATEIGGVKHYLHYTIEIMFEACEKYGSESALFELLDKQDKEGFDANRWLAVRMANSAERKRAEAGEERTEILRETDISETMTPFEVFVKLHNDLVSAIRVGKLGEVPEDEKEEVDLGLLELEEKNGIAGA